MGRDKVNASATAKSKTGSKADNAKPDDGIVFKRPPKGHKQKGAGKLYLHTIYYQTH